MLQVGGKSITQSLIEREAVLFVFPFIEESTMYVGYCGVTQASVFLLENKSSQYED